MVESPGQERFAVHIVKALKESGADVPKELEDLADYLFQIAQCGAEKYYGVGSGDVAFDRNAVPHMCRSLDLKAQNIIERLLAMALSDKQKLEILDRHPYSMSDTTCDHTLPSRCQA
jgi:hypothetical protein